MEKDFYIKELDKIIDSWGSLSPEIKIEILKQVRDYINEISIKTTHFEENIEITLKNNILKSVLIKLENFLKETENKKVRNLIEYSYSETRNENIIFELKSMMRKTVKDCYIDYLKNNNFGLNNIKHDNISKDYFNNSSELDKKIYMLMTAYEFAGYNSKNSLGFSSMEEEICSLLNISKLKFYKSNLKFAYYVIKSLYKVVVNNNVRSK